jgi:hypothetical protein
MPSAGYFQYRCLGNSDFLACFEYKSKRKNMKKIFGTLGVAAAMLVLFTGNANAQYGGSGQMDLNVGLVSELPLVSVVVFQSLLLLIMESTITSL